MTSSKVQDRSSSERDKLTDDERNFLTESMASGQPICPDCERGRLLAGPSGGMSQNVMCEFCSSEFNLTFVGSQCIFSERISDAGPRDAGIRKGLYSGLFGRQ